MVTVPANCSYCPVAVSVKCPVTGAASSLPPPRPPFAASTLLELNVRAPTVPPTPAAAIMKFRLFISCSLVQCKPLSWQYQRPCDDRAEVDARAKACIATTATPSADRIQANGAHLRGAASVTSLMGIPVFMTAARAAGGRRCAVRRYIDAGRGDAPVAGARSIRRRAPATHRAERVLVTRSHDRPNKNKALKSA